MSQNTDRSKVMTVDDIVLGSLDAQLEAIRNLEKNIELNSKHLEPISFEDFCKENSELNTETEEGKILLNKYYNEYTSELTENLEYIKDELTAEAGYTKDPVLKTKINKHGYYDFGMCQYFDAEDEGLSISPYEWRCKLFDGHGHLLAMAYGTLYSMPRDTSEASEDDSEDEGGGVDIEWPDAHDIPYVADIHTSQEISVVSKFIELLDEEREDEIMNTHHFLEEQIMEGPIVFIQYLKRDLTNPTIKGAGFDTLKFALECIFSHFSTNYMTTVAYVDIYKNVDSSYAKRLIPKLILKTQELIAQHPEKHIDHYDMSFWI